MKRFLVAALAAAGCLVLAQETIAQTCTGFSGNVPLAPLGGRLTGNTCQAGGSALAMACTNAETLNGAGVAIYQVLVGTNSFWLTVDSTNFVPWLGFIGSPCSSNTACKDDVTRSGTGSISTAIHSEGDTPSGTYYLIIGDVDVDTPGCGEFTLYWWTSPVSLQSFSIE